MSILTPNKLYKDLDFSFSVHPNTKDVLKKIDNNALKQSIKSLLFTTPGERLFQPDIGSGINRMLFEPIDFITSEALKKNIEYTLTNYEPRIQVESITIDPNEDYNGYDICIYFTAIGVNQPTSLTITLQRLR